VLGFIGRFAEARDSLKRALQANPTSRVISPRVRGLRIFATTRNPNRRPSQDNSRLLRFLNGFCL
jgi:hypothetical protein